jgi:hypothetical protein
VGWLALSLLSAKTRACVPFHLKTEDGKIINPLTFENPGDYDLMTQGQTLELPGAGSGWHRFRNCLFEYRGGTCKQDRSCTGS